VKSDRTVGQRFLKACRREPVDCTPVWFMRQAGRYMEEFRAIRQKHSLLEVAKNPELAVEVTLQPLKKLNLDAAIIFADILLPLEPMGIRLEFQKGEGPVIHNPVRSKADVEALRVIDAGEDLSFVAQAVRMVRAELNGRIPLIGFAGAPFTLASYLIEGGHSKNHILVKKMMYHEPKVWAMFMDKLARVVADYLKSQIKAGAQAVQLFDSWVGCLSPGDYQEYVLPYSRRVIKALSGEGVPIIHFGTDTAMLLEFMREAGGDVIGLDWRVNLDEAWRRIGYDVGVQGNLDPVVLFAPLPEIEKRVKDILRRAENRPGHIFNLGHGILPETPMENVKAVVEMVHEYSQR
jgi:uroporphyrinogen decarboxylase